MSDKWLVIGITGVTCGGKTTLSKNLQILFPNNSRVISQDDYFFECDDKRHTWIKELNHINFDIVTSLDMAKMVKDIKKILSENSTHANINSDNNEISINSVNNGICSNGGNNVNSSNNSVRNNSDGNGDQRFQLDSNKNLLIIEGFCVFYEREIVELCDLRYFFKLDKTECLQRREIRVYDPPDCPGYFELSVWPEYLLYRDYVEDNIQGVQYLSGDEKSTIEEVLCDVERVIS